MTFYQQTTHWGFVHEVLKNNGIKIVFQNRFQSGDLMSENLLFDFSKIRNIVFFSLYVNTVVTFLISKIEFRY